MIRALFWKGTAGLVYSYVLLPNIILARPLLWPYNEARGIGPKLETVLEQHYRADRRSVVVASDASDDGTPEIVAALAYERWQPALLPSTTLQ